MRIKTKKYFYGGLVFIAVSMLVFQSYVFYELKKDLDIEVRSIEDSLLNLDNKINSQKGEIEKEVSDLRNESANAIKNLGGNIDALVKESVESKKAIEE